MASIEEESHRVECDRMKCGLVGVTMLAAESSTPILSPKTVNGLKYLVSKNEHQQNSI